MSRSSEWLGLLVSAWSEAGCAIAAGWESIAVTVVEEFCWGKLCVSPAVPRAVLDVLVPSVLDLKVESDFRIGLGYLKAIRELPSFLSGFPCSEKFY